MQKTKQILTVLEAIAHQQAHYGCVAYGRDALYALAHSGRVAVVRNGKRRLLFPASSIDKLMQGDTEGQK